MAKADLAGLLAQARESVNRLRCTTCKFLAEADPADAEVLSAAFSDPEMSSAVIARALNGYGVSVSLSAVSRHRRECR